MLILIYHPLFIGDVHLRKLITWDYPIKEVIIARAPRQCPIKIFIINIVTVTTCTIYLEKAISQRAYIANESQNGKYCIGVNCCNEIPKVIIPQSLDLM